MSFGVGWDPALDDVIAYFFIFSAMVLQQGVSEQGLLPYGLMFFTQYAWTMLPAFYDLDIITALLP